MSAASYDLLKEHIVAIGQFYATPVVRHVFNSDDKRDVILRHALEAACLLEMGRECVSCRGEGVIVRLGMGRPSETCSFCKGTGWQNDRHTPLIDRLAMCDVGPVTECDSCSLHGPSKTRCPTCSWTLPTAPCETCGGTGRVMCHPEPFPITCPSCRGLKKDNQGRPAHEHQPPGNWDREARDTNGPGELGLRDDTLAWGLRDNSPVGGTTLVHREPTDYPAGIHPTGDDDAGWSNMWTFEVVHWRKRYGTSKTLTQEIARQNKIEERVDAAREAIRQAKAVRHPVAP